MSDRITQPGQYGRTAADDPHRGQPVYHTGAPLERAAAAAIMLHGRGAAAHDILSLAVELDQPGVAYLAPQAVGFTWYPNRFTAPLASNEPYLSSALAVVRDLLAAVEQAGVPASQTVILGFSQGACLAVEFAARHAQRYGGVAALSGGLIGPDDAPRDYPGTLNGTPVLLACSDVDPHIPLARVQHSTEIMRALGGEVTERIYPGMGHMVNADEIRLVRDMLGALLAESDGRPE
jgi:phospholipase/carboxylesterase